jgi:predicted acylesterase/phospholipase RssA
VRAASSICKVMLLQPRHEDLHKKTVAQVAGGGGGIAGRLNSDDSHQRSSRASGPVNRIKSTIHRTLSKASLRKSRLDESHDRTSSLAPLAPTPKQSLPPSSDPNNTPLATENTIVPLNEGREKYKWQDAEDEDDPWSGRAILALDGGGIRGLASLFVLKKLMEEIANIEMIEAKEGGRSQARQPAEYRPCHYFDLIGGTSSGGLVAIMLGRLRMTVDEAMVEYKKLSENAFMTKGHKWLRPNSLPEMDSGRLEETVQETFEKLEPENSSVVEEAKLFRSDSMRCRTVVCSMFVNPSAGSAEPVLFRSYPISLDTGNVENPVARDVDSAEYCKIWQVARATTAAPTYFESHEAKYVDPAPFLYNPSWEVYKECTRPLDTSSTHIDLFLSIGSEVTSQTFATAHRGKLRLHRTSKMLKRAATIQKFAGVVDEAMRTRDFSNSWYRRIKIETEGKVGESFEEVCEKGVQREHVKKIVEGCARVLVRMRKRRENTMLWEQFAEGVRYVCPIIPDHQTQYFQTRVELKDHLQVKHGLFSDSNHRKEMQEQLDAGRRSGSVKSGHSSPARQSSN